MALHRIDYDADPDVFIITRPISARKLVNRKKNRSGARYTLPQCI